MCLFGSLFVFSFVWLSFLFFGLMSITLLLYLEATTSSEVVRGPTKREEKARRTMKNQTVCSRGPFLLDFFLLVQKNMFSNFVADLKFASENESKNLFFYQRGLQKKCVFFFNQRGWLPKK